MISMREKNFWSLKSIKKTVGETMELLEKARDKVASIFSVKQGNEPKRKSQMRLQNRHKSEKRIRLRYKENEEAIQRKILQIQEDTELTLDKDFVIDHDITDAIATLKVHEIWSGLMRRCHAKQTRGDKHVTIQNKSAVSLEQEEDVKSEKDQDEMEEVDEEEEDDNSSSFKF
ncbi:hypothetical protein pdam_00016867 [Pocillopora damicornis]|uniref:Uncharacterized protein n=1 Tax=Pocillopora damicornis TaxID=46731 RepID=A0A3M6UG48_POCDA|nr:hypothetical protein pdam_00016867 [Pocillopora damicornis]